MLDDDGDGRGTMSLVVVATRLVGMRRARVGRVRDSMSVIRRGLGCLWLRRRL